MKAKAAAVVAASILFISVLFYFVYHNDNKYQNIQPNGKQGILIINDADIASNKPIFLIDDWEFYADHLYSTKQLQTQNIIPDRYLFIGQYPNFTLMRDTPHIHKATYRLRIDHRKSTKTLYMQVPEIFTKYRIYINGALQDVKTGDMVSLGSAQTSEILLWIEESTHYYDGMTYPMAIGSLTTLQRVASIQHDLYFLMFAFALIIFFYAITLRKKDRDHVFHCFALLSLSFALYCLYPFLHIHLSTYHSILYTYEDVTYTMMCILLIHMCALLANFEKGGIYRHFIRSMNIVILILCILVPCLILPNHKEFVNAYGALIDLYRWISSLFLLICSFHACKRKNPYAISILAGGSIFALCQLFNFFFNNLYEPIYGLWQAEYGAFFILLVFFAVILKRNRLIMDENKRLNEQLAQEVEQRTADITKLLHERKAFFADIAHDLKAPLSAIQNYTQLIVQNDIALDNEIRSYLHSIARKNHEMSERLLSMNRLTQVDKLDQDCSTISLLECLQAFYEENLPEADALGIHFTFVPTKEDVLVYAQKAKINVVLENLFYNALSFTPADGYITLRIKRCRDHVEIVFSDTGCGIAPEHLPHIFERFYSRRSRENEQSGLGLYIVKMIITELSGTIDVTSEVGKGTCFIIQLSCINKPTIQEDDAYTL